MMDLPPPISCSQIKDANDLELGETWRDKGVALTKGGLGFIPFAGSFIGEIIAVTVPNQRLDRIETYLRHLNERIADLSGDQKILIKSSYEHIDLIEEGIFRAARALDEKRRIALAAVVASGLDGDKQKALDQKRILEIFAGLAEDDIIFLLSFDLINRGGWESFYEQHARLFEPLYATVWSPPDVRARAALREAIRLKLVSLGLIREDTLLIKSRETLSLDQQMIETQKKDQITELGRMILREAALIPAEPNVDWHVAGDAPQPLETTAS